MTGTQNSEQEAQGIGDVLHRLVDNSPGFSLADRAEAHASITDAHGGERHWLVPDPDNPDAGRNDPAQTDIDPRDAEIARLKRELAQRDNGQDTDGWQLSQEPVTVADQRAAGVPDDEIVTVAEQRAGAPAPEAVTGKHAAE
jgi:hypothetical protein